MKVLLTGARGQLGRELALQCPTSVSLVALDRAALDIADGPEVRHWVAENRPDVILNAAAYTAVDRAETEPELAHAVNGDGVGHLAVSAAAHGVRLVHVSTDFVFDGEANEPYSPATEPDPQSAYGASKLVGERAVLDTEGLRGVVVRTAWLYSRFGHNFVKTMLRLMAERDRLEVVDDQIGCPTWARSLATALWRIVDRPEIEGVLHWTDAGVASWYDFAIAIQDEATDLGLLRPGCRVRPVATAQFPTPARRPSYSVLEIGSSAEMLDLEPDHWRRHLRSMLHELRDYGDT